MPALLLVGVTSVISQVVLLRELLVASHGNELSLGLALALWLLLTAGGSALLGAFLARYTSTWLLAGLQTTSAAALPLAVYLIRSCRSWLDAGVGEALGPLSILAVSTLSLAAFCPLSGALFTLGSRLWSCRPGLTTVDGCTSMYLLEAIGSAIGGLTASLILLRTLDSFQIAFLLLVVSLWSGIWLLVGRFRNAIMASVCLAPLLPVAAVAGSKLNAASIAMEWHGFTLAQTRNSRYGTLAVLESEGNRSLLQSGTVLFTVPDPLSAEEAVHFAMLEHPAPASVLLIGGALNGRIDEVLKHPSVVRIDFLELDPAIIETAREAFPAVWKAISLDHRVHSHQVDGRLFLKDTKQSFDVILVSLPEPQTSQLNRYYTEEFFREASARLARGGLLSFRLTAGEEYRSPERTQFLRSIHATLKRAFGSTVVVPGESVSFIACNQPCELTSDASRLVSRLRERNVRTEYVSEYFLPHRMSPERVKSLRAELEAHSDTPINRDFEPVAYYYNVALWGTQFSARFRSAFRAAAGVSFGTVLSIVLGITVLSAVLCLRGQRQATTAAAFSVSVSGLTLMAVEVLLLLGFQAVHGYVFEELAIVVAAFMAGMALGSWCVTRMEAAPRNDITSLALLQAAMLLLPALVTGALMLVAGRRHVAVILVPMSALLAGAIGGAQFAAAARICVASRDKPISPGVFYGLDLLGACLGAVAISVYLLPVFGFARTSALLAAVNVAPLLSLGCALLRSRFKTA